MTLTSFRQTVQTRLEDQLGIQFFAGRFDVPQENRDVGCCWVVGKREQDDIVANELIEVHARVFKMWKLDQGFTQAQVTDLEQLLEQVQTSLRDIQTTAGPWLFRVVDLEIVYELSCVEATMIGTQDNLHAVGG